MNTRHLAHWRKFSLVVCAFALNVSVHAQSVKIIASDPVALEGTSTASFTLIRADDATTNSDLAVNLDISGTASNGVDYTAISSPVTIPAGYLAVDVLVQPILDTVNRGNKTVILTLDTNSGTYAVTGSGHATVKIVDDVFDVPPPTVTLTSPGESNVFTIPATITLAANVDCELPILRVGFYQDDKLLATVTNAPYTYVWTSSDTGKHTLFARAVDEANKAGVSDTVEVTLSATPIVTVVVPSSIFADQNYPVQAQIGDPNEPISSVSFYINNKLVGTVTSAPFIYYWNDNTTGTFNLKAVATDANTGLTGTSAKVSVTVEPFNGGGS
jgi:hypothetical protein